VTPLLVVLFVIAALAVVVRFEAFCLNDLANAEDYELQYFSRRAWMFLCLFVVPFGGILYLLRGKAR
jgi:hypothetical protein